MKVNARKIGLFLGLTFAVNWLMAGLFRAFGGRWGTLPAVALGAAYMLVPMAAAVVVQKLVWKERLREPLGIRFKPNRWFLVAWLLPPVLATAAFGAALLVPGVEYSPEMAGFYERLAKAFPPEKLAEMREQAAALPLHPFWLGLAQALVAGITVNAVFGFGEELGWRGLLQRELAPFGFWPSSLLVGVIWGVWHAPIIIQGHNYPEHPVGGVFMMVAWCVLLSPIFAYVRARSRSVVAAAIAHGSLNGSWGLSIILVKGGSDLTVGLAGLAGFVVLAAANAALFLHDRFVAAEPIMSRREELLEVVDDEGRVVGLETRSRCHAGPAADGTPPLAHRAVHVFVRNSRGDIFLQKRAATKRIEPGRWDTSVGGHLAPGETYESAAERELFEELGVCLRDIGGPAALRPLHDYVWRSPVETEHVRTFEVVAEGPFRLHPDEIEAGRFWTVDEVRAAVGTGVLTPNLEEELRRTGLAGQGPRPDGGGAGEAGDRGRAT